MSLDERNRRIPEAVHWRSTPSYKSVAEKREDARSRKENAKKEILANLENAGLVPLQRVIIEMTVGGKTIRQIGERLGLSPNQVSAIKRKAIHALTNVPAHYFRVDWGQRKTRTSPEK